ARSCPSNFMARVGFLGLLVLLAGTSCSQKVNNQKTRLFATVRVSIGSIGQEGNGPVGNPAVPTAIDKADISDDGRFVAFTSTANNLVPNGGTGKANVFLRDNVAKTTTLVSINLLGNNPGDQ